MLNKITFLSLLLVFSMSVFGQENNEYKPHVFLSLGFVAPQYFSGTELLRSNDLRQKGLSYYQDTSGNRNQVGEYGSNTGWSLSFGYYFPIRKVRGLSVGLLVHSGQTGSQPSEGGHEEGYYFNFVNYGIGLQYYPFENNGLYLKGDIGSGAVFTKNRFITDTGDQDFLHYFGIGLEAGGAIGYTFYPFKNKKLGLNLETSYQYYNTRVEVSGIGDDIWRFGAANFTVGFQF